MVHLEINPIKAYVLESVLYDEDPNKKDLIPCTIFAISSYQGETITFAIELDNGSIFFYIPIHKLTISKTSDMRLQLNSLVYNNCESNTFTINYYKYLSKKEDIIVFIKNEKEWIQGKYIMTLDWYNGNDLMHLLTLSNGQFACLPSHKIKFNGIKDFRDYKKMHSTWKV